MEKNTDPQYKQCEQDLKLAKERLLAISMQTDRWLWETDVNHRFCFFTDNVEQLTGLKKADLLGTSRLELARQSEGLSWQEHGKDLVNQRPFKDFRYVRKSPDGQGRHLIVSGWPIYDEAGCFAGFRGTGWDETAMVEHGRRQAEKEEDLLSEIESQRVSLETVLENLSQSVMWFDQYGSIRLNNAQTQKLLDFDEQQYCQVTTISQHLRLMAERGDFGDVDIESEVKRRTKRLCSRQQKAITYRIHLKASDRFLDIGLRPLSDGSRILTHTDVTKEARKDRELSEREAVLSTVIDNVDYGLLFMDKDLNCELVNNRFNEMWGMPPEFLHQKPSFAQVLEHNRFTGFYDVDANNDKAWNAYVEMRLEGIKSNDDGTVKSAEVARGDGRYFKFSNVSLPGGKYMATYFDITEIKQMEIALRETNDDLELQLQVLNQREAALESLVDNIDYGTLVLDKNQKVELANRKFRELMSIDVAFLESAPSMVDVLDRMFENKCTGLISGDRSQWPQYRTSIAEQIQQGQFLTSERVRQDGKTILSSCMKLPGGRRLVTYFDMTRHIEREAQLEAMQNDLAQANELLEYRVEKRTQELRQTQSLLVRKERQALLGDLVASLCHELRNPLNALNTSLYLVRRNVEGDYPKLTKAFDRSERTIKRCTNILNDLYAYALVEDLNKEPAAMDLLMHKVVEQAKVPQSIAVELDIASDLPVCDLDEGQLAGALGKIIVNAVQAISDDGAISDDSNVKVQPTIVVYAGNCGDFIEIIISDNGPGMHEEIFARALEPLFSTRGFGVGLGLPIAEQIIKRHGGEIKLETLESAGTTVTIWLPASTLAPDQARVDKAG